MGKPFQSVDSNRPGRSVFDLSYSKLFTCDMGQLIPVLHDEMVPGDKFKIANEIVVRMQPLVAPILHEINVFVHYFFVPYRLLWDGWETFITGGVAGTDASVLPRSDLVSNPAMAKGTIWDYLGYPVGIFPGTANAPLEFPRLAYNKIFNDYYRDETLQPEIPIASDNTNQTTHYTILQRNWEKDYFTSSLPWQQRGTAPSMPISGMTPLIDMLGGAADSVAGFDTSLPTNMIVNAGVLAANPVLGVDLSTATTFDVADLRLAFQIQRWLERNARAGIRYTEFLKAHFGVSPRDDRLQRPEYIGGSKSPLIVSEVLQTSESNTSPQGTMAGHGISASQSFCGEYHAQEFGIVMGIMSIMPKPMYSQGFNRQWLRRSKYDFYFPEFANLSEQAIERMEIYADATPSNNITTFGYQGRYDEMRYKPNLVCSDMRDIFDYWHLGREFGSAPSLNASFISCVPDKRIFAVPTDPGFIVSHGNIVKAIRPIPVSSEPGLIDHG